MKFEILIDRMFSNFHRIIFTNLIFSVPLFLTVAIYYLLQRFLNKAILTLFLLAVASILFVFYAGVVLVCRNIARGDTQVKVFSTFFKGVKENGLKFLLYGALISIVFLFSYYSISIYSKLLSQSWLFYALLFVCILIALAILFIFFYVPVMTVTFDLSIRHIFKNSFLMSFGEIKNNFFALFALAIVLAICFTITAFCTQAYLLIIITVLLFALILPASCQFVVSFFVYDDMYGSIAQRDAKSEQIAQAIKDAKDSKNTTSFVEDYSDVDISTLKDCDDYIFYKGKMIKQSVLLKKALEQRENNESKD